ncbi:Acetyltransferase aurG [Pseudocercospora fuligena]|uniref:Acetyltransferase aurG n=1 Tax=Pseudocercospora fuligena TaxID=685502 RepID=A0A8H6VCU8_9PEZI|nr:Acetyltransferase aurG [Pseudocercospora fuligena]
MATPILSLAFSVLTITFTISSPTRPDLLIPQTAILASTAVSFSTSGQLPDPWDSTWALMMAVWLSHSTSILWIEDWHFWKEVNPSPKNEPISIWKIWNNPRLISTPLQVIKPASTQSLLTFTTYRLAKAAAYLFIYIFILPLTFSPSILRVQLDDFSAVHTTYFRRINQVTYHETLIRIIWTFLWALGPYLTLETAHALFSILFVVVLRTDEPEEWPPLFGSISEAYNLRRFWGVFWHRLIARPYSNFGRIVGKRMFGGKTKGLVVAFVVFGLSGLAHAATAWLFGDNHWKLDILWFLECFVGGAVEAVVLGLMRRAFMVIGQEQLWLAIKRSAVARLLGYCWVFLFFFWSVPKWQYPETALCDTG